MAIPYRIANAVVIVISYFLLPVAALVDGRVDGCIRSFRRIKGGNSPKRSCLVDRKNAAIQTELVCGETRITSCIQVGDIDCLQNRRELKLLDFFGLRLVTKTIYDDTVPITNTIAFMISYFLLRRPEPPLRKSCSSSVLSCIAF
uniref:Secreted protein n=1 Tax=Steinernema glaseri TaxID=37863 RepID=A0A1I7YZW0_9BILA